MSNAILSPQATAKARAVTDLLRAKAPAISALLPRHLVADRYVRLVVALVARKPELLECSPASILQSVMLAGRLGLECDSTMNQGHLVPYKGKCTFIPGYMGLVELE